MQITDKVYGKFVISEPILVELINSKPLQRLKGINQAGASQYAIKRKTVTRYDHSVGVMILLKKLGASIEEQIAGLLHDVPHTAFSHVIDFVFKEKNDKHEFHEKFHKKIILESEIPSILKKFGFDINRIIDEHNFNLLERQLPDLCADRIDYTLRDMVAFEGFKKKINIYLSSFVIRDGEIMMDDRLTAKNFAEDYLRMDEENWSHPQEVALFQILADALKIALEKKIINKADLFKNDKWVYSKLKESKNKSILIKLDMLNPKIKIIDDPKNFDFHSRNKLRYIDPTYINSENSATWVSHTFNDFSDKLEKHKEWIKRGNFIKIISY